MIPWPRALHCSVLTHLLLCPGGGFVGTCSVSPAWGRWWASLVARGVVKKKVFTNVLAWLRGHCGTALALLTAPAGVWLQVISCRLTCSTHGLSTLGTTPMEPSARHCASMAMVARTAAGLMMH